MTVKDVLDRVTALYNDINYVRVPQETYLKFLDDAILALILSRPDAHVKTDVVALSTGTRQDIPTDGFKLIDIYLNRGQDGTAYGSPILQVERKDLDYFSNWHMYSSDITEINEFAYDPRSPRTFWVSPPVGTVPVYVEMDYSYGATQYSTMPDTFESILDMMLPVDDIFRGPIVSYMLFLLYSTDSASDADRQMAQRYEQSFYQSLGLEYKATVIIMPKIDNVEVGQVQQNG